MRRLSDELEVNKEKLHRLGSRLRRVVRPKDEVGFGMRVACS
jgi:hypothetical protein